MADSRPRRRTDSERRGRERQAIGERGRQPRGSRTLGDRVRKFRTQLNLSQEAVAHQVGRSEGWLLQVENGRADPSYGDLLELARVLGIELGALIGPPTEGAPATGPELEAQERLQRVVSGPLRADMQVVDYLHRLLADWRVLDDLLGPRALLPLTMPVCELLDELSQDSAAPVRNALLTCGAEYQQFVGWLWVDLGDHRQARGSYERAIARAIQSGRDELAGYLLACQAEHAIVENRPALARSLAEAAQARRCSLTPAVVGWSADLEARTWATEGNEAGCRRKLEDARELLRVSADNDRADEPSWIYHFVPDAFRIHEGMCLADLGQARLAIDSLQATIAALDPGRVRDRAYYLSYLAKAHAGNTDPDSAARVGQEALILAAQAGSWRIVSRLDQVNGELRPWRDVQAVREFSEALQMMRTS